MQSVQLTPSTLLNVFADFTTPLRRRNTRIWTETPWSQITYAAKLHHIPLSWEPIHSRFLLCINSRLNCLFLIWTRNCNRIWTDISCGCRCPTIKRYSLLPTALLPCPLEVLLSDRTHNTKLDLLVLQGWFPLLARKEFNFNPKPSSE